MADFDTQSVRSKQDIVDSSDRYTVASANSSTASGRAKVIETKAYGFLNSIRPVTSLPRIAILAIHIVVLIQSCFIVMRTDTNWGPTAKWVAHGLLSTWSLGLQFIPYNGLIYVLVIACVIQVLAAIALIIAFRAMTRGSQFWNRIKVIVRIACAVAGAAGPAIVYALFGYLDCDWRSRTFNENTQTYSEFILMRFPAEYCLSVQNGIMGAVAGVVIAAQFFFTGFAVLIFTDMNPRAIFSVDGPVMMLYILFCNMFQSSLVDLLDLATPVLKPCVAIALSLGGIGVLFYLVPHFRKFENSLYAAAFGFRIGLAIAVLLVDILNGSGSDIIGYSLLGAGVGLGLIIGLVVFLVMYSYLALVQFRIQRSVIPAIVEGEIPKSMYFLDVGIRLSMNSKDQALIERVITSPTLAREQNVKMMVNTGYYYLYYKSQTPVAYTFQMLRKCFQSGPNIVLKYKLYIGLATCESLIQDKQNNPELRRIMDSVTKKQDEIRYNIREFWKLLAEGAKMSEVLYVSDQTKNLIDDCQATFNNLMVNFPKNPLVIRHYSDFLNSILQSKEEADEMYTYAAELEEEEMKKKLEPKRRPMKKRFSGNIVVPENEEEKRKPYSSPLVTNEVHDDIFDTNQNDNLDDLPESVGGELPDQAYRRAVNQYDSKFLLILTITSMSAIAFVTIIILAILSGQLMTTKTTIRAYDACAIAAMPIYSLSTLRTSQMHSLYSGNQTISDEHRGIIRTVLNYVSSNLQSIMSQPLPEAIKETWRVFDKKVHIPILSNRSAAIKEGGGYFSTPQVITMYEMMSRYMVHTEKLSEIPDVSTMYYTYDFAYLWLNKNAYIDALFTYCDAFYAEDQKDVSWYQAILIAVIVVGAVSALVCTILFAPFICCLLKHRSGVLGIYKTLTKEIVATVYHKLAESIKTDNRPKSPTLQIPVSLRTFIFFIIIVLMVVVCTAIQIVIMTSVIEKRRFISEVQSVAGDSLHHIHRSVSNTGEVVYHDDVLREAIPTSEEVLYDIEHASELLSTLQFGTAKTKPIAGITPELDSIFVDTNLDCEDSSCLSLLLLVQDTFTKIKALTDDIHSASNYTMDETYFDEFHSYMDYLATITEKYEILIKAFLNSQNYDQNLLGLVALTVGTLVCVIVSTFLLVSSLREIEASTNQLRKMLHYLPSEAADDNALVRNYVYQLRLSRTTMVTKSDDKAEAILNAAVDGVVIAGAYGNIILINPSAMEMFGYNSVVDIVGSNVTALFTTASQESIATLIKEVHSSAKGSRLEVDGLKKNGSTFPVLISMNVTQWENKKILILYMRDITSEKKYHELLEGEKKTSERLLLNILPIVTATRLKNGETFIAEKLEDVTCFFSDMVGFTKMSSTLSAPDLVTLLNTMVSAFDILAERHHLEKIKTIGDAYFCVGGLHSGGSDHPENVMRFAIDLVAFTKEFDEKQKPAFAKSKIELRCGIHTGPVVGGVIGRSKFAYDLWGDTVNLASRMESTGLPGRIQISRATYQRVHDLFVFEERRVEVKGKGMMTSYVYVCEKATKGATTPVSEEIPLAVLHKESSSNAINMTRSRSTASNLVAVDHIPSTSVSDLAEGQNSGSDAPNSG